MKEKPGLREIASTLHQELNQRFESILDPQTPVFDPIYVKLHFLTQLGTELYSLTSAQIEAAKSDILRKVSTWLIVNYLVKLYKLWQLIIASLHAGGDYKHWTQDPRT